MNIEKAIEMLQCAEVNCDNITAMGRAGILVVKAQIQSALKQLEGQTICEDVLADYRDTDTQADASEEGRDAR